MFKFLKKYGWWLLAALIGVLLIIQYAIYRNCINNIKDNYDSIIEDWKTTKKLPCRTVTYGLKDENTPWGILMERGSQFPFPLFDGVVITKNDKGEIIEK